MKKISFYRVSKQLPEEQLALLSEIQGEIQQNDNADLEAAQRLTATFNRLRVFLYAGTSNPEVQKATEAAVDSRIAAAFGEPLTGPDSGKASPDNVLSAYVTLTLAMKGGRAVAQWPRMEGSAYVLTTDKSEDYAIPGSLAQRLKEEGLFQSCRNKGRNNDNLTMDGIAAQRRLGQKMKELGLLQQDLKRPTLAL